MTRSSPNEKPRTEKLFKKRIIFWKGEKLKQSTISKRQMEIRSAHGKKTEGTCMMAENLKILDAL